MLELLRLLQLSMQILFFLLMNKPKAQSLTVLSPKPSKLLADERGRGALERGWVEQIAALAATQPFPGLYNGEAEIVVTVTNPILGFLAIVIV